MGFVWSGVSFGIETSGSPETKHNNLNRICVSLPVLNAIPINRIKMFKTSSRLLSTLISRDKFSLKSADHDHGKKVLLYQQSHLLK